MNYFESKIFKNEDALSPEYLPESLPHRENQIEKIAKNLEPASKRRKPQNTFIVGPPGIGKCLAPKTPVLLANGDVKNIDEIYDECIKYNNGSIKKLNKNETIISNPNISVLSLNNEFKIVNKRVGFIFKQKYKGKMYKVLTSSGREIIVTPDHPLLTIKNVPTFEPAKHLSKGDFIAIPRNVTYTRKINIQDIYEKFVVNLDVKNPKHVSNMIKIPKINNSFLRFLGLIISEGSFSSNYCIKFHNKNQSLLKEFQTITKRVFGINSKIRKHKNKCPYIEINSSLCFNLLSNIDESIVKNSPKRKIPNFVFNLPKNFLSEFLKALFDGEGSVYGNKDSLCIEFATSSNNIANQITYLLLRYGIVARIKRKVGNGKTSYRVLILGKNNVKSFYDNIGFSSSKKNGLLLKYILSKKKTNTNVDIIPNLAFIVNNILLKSKLKIKNTHAENIIEKIRQNKGVDRDRLNLLCNYLNNSLECLRRMKHNLDVNASFDRILEIKKLINVFWKDVAYYLHIHPDTFRYHVRKKSKLLNKMLPEIIIYLNDILDHVIDDTERFISILNNLGNSDIFWDKIKRIEAIKNNHDFIYDLNVPETNTFIAGFGSLIVHNTACVKFIFKQFEEYSGIQTVYINTWNYNTSVSILTKIVISLNYPLPRRGLSKDEILEKLIELLRRTNKSLIVCLDEVDQLIKKDESVLYDLLRLNQYVDNPIGLVMISNYKDVFVNLEPRIKSSLDVEEIEFKPYSLQEMKDILEERCKEAFRLGVIENGVILLCANHAISRGGDVRVGLECLRKASRIAEDEDSDKITVKHIKQILSEVKSVKLQIMKEKLEGVEKNIVSLLKNNELTSTQLYNKYIKEFGKISQNALRKHVRHLEDIGLVRVKISRKDSKGRKYFISLVKRKIFK